MMNSSILTTQSSCMKKLQKPQNLQNQKEIQKNQLHIALFALNLLMMTAVPATNVYGLFGNPYQLSKKAYLGISLIAYCSIIIPVTALNLKLKFIDFLKSFFILDSINLSTAVTTLAFMGMMKYLDRQKWQMKVIEAAFGIAIASSGINVRILLLHMKWKPWKVIVFKIVLYIIALTYFTIGVYCFYTDYSFTFNILKAFDKQVKYFVLLFQFAAFEFSLKLVKTMSNFDYTQKLKYVYKIKNVSKGMNNDHKMILSRKEMKKMSSTVNLKQTKINSSYSCHQNKYL